MESINDDYELGTKWHQLSETNIMKIHQSRKRNQIDVINVHYFKHPKAVHERYLLHVKDMNKNKIHHPQIY